MFSDLHEIRPWLQARTDLSPYGGRLLKMAYPPEHKARLFEVYTELARHLQAQPEITRRLLRGETGGWYSHLIGNVIAILQRNAEVSIELAQRIMEGSFAAPQLAAGFALTTQGDGVAELEQFLDTIHYEPSSSLPPDAPKKYLSAYAALKLLGTATADTFSQKPVFEQLTALDRDSCVGWTERYYREWKDVPPV